MPVEFQDYLYEYWVKNFDEHCSYCNNNIECKVEECPKYENYGKRGSMINPDGTETPMEFYYDMTCLDLNFGDCPMLENTPCHECIENNMRSFEWNGIIPTSYGTL